MRRDTTPHPTPHSPHPELRRALDGTYYTRSAFFKWYGTNEVWENAKPVVLAWDGRVSSTAEATSPAARSHPQPSSAGQPACAAPRLSVQSAPCLVTQLSASKFLDTLEEATYKHEANPTQVTLLRELVNSLSSGDLLLMPTDEVWHLDEDQQEEKAIAKLDKLIELVVNIRTAWIASPEGEFARMSGHELQAAAEALLNSMSREKRAEYDFCFQARGSQRFLFALLRQPSFFNAEDLEKLLEEWANIKNSSEYKAAIKESKRRTELQTKQKAELQNLRIRINRKRQKREGTEDLLRELRDKEKSYDRANQLPLGPTPPPLRAHDPRRAASARRPLRSRREIDDIPPMPNRLPPFVLNWPHEITPELDVDWTLCPDDYEKELRLREVRNQMLKEQLQKGKPVIYRSSGWSLWPRVWPNDQCTYAPVTSADDVNMDDIVFCQVQPGNRFYGHVVSDKWFQEDKWYFTISNLKGRSNGWCTMEHIYGRLLRCLH